MISLRCLALRVSASRLPVLSVLTCTDLYRDRCSQDNPGGAQPDRPRAGRRRYVHEPRQRAASTLYICLVSNVYTACTCNSFLYFILRPTTFLFAPSYVCLFVCLCGTANVMTAETPADVMRIFAQGSSRRTTASTQMNAESSRSHLICSLGQSVARPLLHHY